MSQYNMEIIYVHGKNSSVADALLCILICAFPGEVDKKDDEPYKIGQCPQWEQPWK